MNFHEIHPPPPPPPLYKGRGRGFQLLCVSLPLWSLFFKSMLSNTNIVIRPFSVLLGSKDDCCSNHSANLSFINFVSVYDMTEWTWPNMCKSSITVLEPIFLYMLSDSKTWLNNGVVFDINDSIDVWTNLRYFGRFTFWGLHTTVYIKWWIRTNN